MELNRLHVSHPSVRKHKGLAFPACMSGTGHTNLLASLARNHARSRTRSPSLEDSLQGSRTRQESYSLQLRGLAIANMQDRRELVGIMPALTLYTLR